MTEVERLEAQIKISLDSFAKWDSERKILEGKIREIDSEVLRSFFSQKVPSGEATLKLNELKQRLSLFRETIRRVELTLPALYSELDREREKQEREMREAEAKLNKKMGEAAIKKPRKVLGGFLGSRYLEGVNGYAVIVHSTPEPPLFLGKVGSSSYVEIIRKLHASGIWKNIKIT